MNQGLTSFGVELGGAKEETTRNAKCLHYKKIQKNAAKCLIHMDPTPANGEKRGWKCRTRVHPWTRSLVTISNSPT